MSLQYMVATKLAKHDLFNAIILHCFTLWFSKFAFPVCFQSMFFIQNLLITLIFATQLHVTRAIKKTVKILEVRVKTLIIVN